MLRGELPALALLAVSIALLAIPHGTSQPRRTQHPTIVPAVTLAAATAAIVLACYLPYAVFAEWFYLRFLLPALPFLFIAIASLAVTAASRLIPDIAGIGLLIAATAVGAFNIRIAAREQVFHLRDFDARYRLAGEYLATALPADAVIVTVQESGSLRHYTGRPMVRWDGAGFDLDKTLATLAAGQHPPTLVIEDWEAAAFRDRFPTSAAARLDWPPRATIPGTTIVRIYDPADRGAAAPPVVDVVR
jgi:hypothetical protein